jgi:hypothetical protein
MVTLRRAHGTDVVRITTAPESPEQEIAHRQKRYLISMGIRTVCFLAAIMVGSGWLRWVLVAAALLLPYVAVIMANSASPRVEGTMPLGPPHDRRELETGSNDPRGSQPPPE